MATLCRPAGDQEPADVAELCRESGSDWREDDLTQKVDWRERVSNLGFSSAFDKRQNRFPNFRFRSECSHWPTEPKMVSVSHYPDLQSTK